MRIIGTVFISVGFALLLFIAYTFWQERNNIKSPIPEEKGVKVIFVTPNM